MPDPRDPLQSRQSLVQGRVPDSNLRGDDLLIQLFENTPVPVALTREADGVIVEVNAQWSALTGWPRAQAIGKSTVELGFWPDATKRASSLSPLVDQGVVVDPEGPLATRDGRHIIASMHGSRILLGGVPHVLVFLVDVTERRRAEEALRLLNAELELRVEQRTRDLAQARDEAEKANRAKADFLSGMSHEWRTPLNAILGFGQLMRGEAGSGLDPRQRGYVTEILRAGEHLLSLVNDVLDFARMEAGKIPVSLEPVDMAGLIDECFGLVAPLAQQNRVSLRPLAGDRSECFAIADRTRARQVVLNLLSNAIKYNRTDGEVSVRCQPDGDRLRVEVCDTGPGLDEEQRSRLFREFERIHSVHGNVPGTGLGLVLCRRLMTLMHGDIGVESQPEVGSVFWIRFERCEPPPLRSQLRGPDGAAARPKVRLPDDRSGSRTHTVLYIEDNPINAFLMREALNVRGDIRLLEADAATTGLDIAILERPALILLDIQLPGVDGYEVLKRLRSHEASRHIPVIAISANAMREDLTRGVAAGFNGYLTKPLDLERLNELIEQFLYGGVSD